MNSEEFAEQTKVQAAQKIYEKLWTEANKELARARQEWCKLQDKLAEVKMMEFAAGEDDSALLPDEEQLLEEMNQKLEVAQSSITFWSRRVDKLRQYQSQVPQFYVRLESDMELHRLRLSLSKVLMEDQSPTKKKPDTGHRRVRLY